MKVCLRLFLVRFHGSEEDGGEMGRKFKRAFRHGMMVTSWTGNSERDRERVNADRWETDIGGVYMQAH